MQRTVTAGLFKTDFLYQNEKGDRKESSLRSLIKNKTNWQWNQDFIENYLNGKDTWPHSPIAGFNKVGKSNHHVNEVSMDFLKSLKNALSLETSKTVHVALSGGLDSQAIALFAKEQGFNVQAYYLKTDIKNYCEAKQVEEFCTRWSISCHEIKTDINDFITSLTPFLTATECPIYNLHPVSKWILAREIQKLGVEQLYSGDGADQTFAGYDFCDLFFLTQNCFQSFGIKLITPFANPAVLSWAKLNGPFTNKEPLRKWAEEKWAIGSVPKHSCYVPDPFKNSNCFNHSLETLRTILCAE